MDVMSAEDRAAFERETTMAARSLAMKRPWILFVLGAALLVVAVLGAIIGLTASSAGDGRAIGIGLAFGAGFAGLIFVGISSWSLRHPQQARRTVELREQYMDRELRRRNPAWILVPVLLVMVLLPLRVLAEGDGVPVWVAVALGVAMAVVVAVAWILRIRKAHAAVAPKTPQSA